MNQSESTGQPLPLDAVGGGGAAGMEGREMNEQLIGDAELAEWKALADAATPGPWLYGRTHNDIGETMPYVIFIMDENGWPDHDSTRMLNEDADFIAASRTAMPRLLAVIAAERQAREAAEARAARLRALLELATNDQETYDYRRGYDSGYAAGQAAQRERDAAICDWKADELEKEWPATVGDFSSHMVAFELAAFIREAAQALPAPVTNTSKGEANID